MTLYEEFILEFMEDLRHFRGFQDIVNWVTPAHSAIKSLMGENRMLKSKAMQQMAIAVGVAAVFTLASAVGNVMAPGKTWGAVLGFLAFLVVIAAGGVMFWRFGKALGGIEQALERMAKGSPAGTLSDGLFEDLDAKVAAVDEYYREKVHWLTSILDAIPFPLSVTDINMNWTFINKPVEGFLKVKRENVIGHQCSEWNANICKTENCGIARLRKNFLTTMFDQNGGNFRVDTSYLYNLKGEKAGHVEVVQEITSMVSARRYQEVAVGQLAGYLKEMAAGRLNFEMQELPSANEDTAESRRNFEMINDTLRQARDMLSSALLTVKDNADKVTEASERLETTSNQAGLATAQIATTIQQVAKGTAHQTEGITKAAGMMEQVSHSVDVVSRGVKEQVEAVNQATAVSQRISGENGINKQFSNSAQKVQEVGKRSEQIGMIVETIEDIASQTNLLALNAAIEAARAGEHGKGFAVVADEVRKLAERASAATKEISSLIKNIQNTVSEAVDITSAVSLEMDEVSQELDGAIRSVSVVVDKNAEASERLNTNSQSVIGAVENVASISEENSAAAEEVSASTEEMNAQVEEVGQAAQELARMAAELRAAVARFELEKAGIKSYAASHGKNGNGFHAAVRVNGR